VADLNVCRKYMKNLYLVLLAVGFLFTAQALPVPEAAATDRFPSGAETPEGAGCDLVRAFRRSDVDLLKTTCIKRYPPAQEKFDQFLAMIIRGTEDDKKRSVPHPKNPAKIVKVFAARHLSKNGPASYGYSVLSLQDVMFVDVLARLQDGSSFVNRTLVVKTQKGLWRVHPCPTVDSLLSAGLNDEPASTVEFTSPEKKEGEQATTGNAGEAPVPAAESATRRP
jgi:hypothetical protein